MIKKNGKRFTAFVFIAMMAMTALFASAGGDDFGFNEYLQKIPTFFTAIGGICLVISLGTWAIKAIVTKNITPEDKKAIIVMAVGGILLLVAGNVVSGLFGELGGVSTN